MMTGSLWTAIFVQMAMGAFDTLYHHEATERLAWRPGQRTELRLHGVRNLVYALLFAALGWCEPHGALAIALLLLLGAELFITLWDFVEEDRSRKLPATERVTHALLTLNYGIVLAMLVPLLLSWADQPSGLPAAYHGAASWLCAGAALGVMISGIRDLAAARRCARLGSGDPRRLAADMPKGETVLVTGGTGFVGSRLVAALVAAGHDVTVLTRARQSAEALPAPIRIVTSLDQIACDARIDAIINLAGEPISNAPWTLAKRRRILASRVRTTREVVRLIDALAIKPKVLISGSAIGWYGLRGDQELTEANLGVPCFSRRVCVAWEEAAGKAAAWGVRTVLLRTGLVLDSEGGMLARMLAPFEFGLGGWFGSGRQWMSWIHRDDLVRMIIHCIADPLLIGPVNATAPAPVTNRVFTAALGRALGRPAFMTIPAPPLRWLLGDFADELLLSGQRVFPAAALATGFEFEYPDVDAALGAIACRTSSSAAVTRRENHSRFNRDLLAPAVGEPSRAASMLFRSTRAGSLHG
jgi:uncharacterized protein (TIGR01777 family)